MPKIKKWESSPEAEYNATIRSINSLQKRINQKLNYLEKTGGDLYHAEQSLLRYQSRFVSTGEHGQIKIEVGDLKDKSLSYLESVEKSLINIQNSKWTSARGQQKIHTKARHSLAHRLGMKNLTPEQFGSITGAFEKIKSKDGDSDPDLVASLVQKFPNATSEQIAKAVEIIHNEPDVYFDDNMQTNDTTISIEGNSVYIIEGGERIEYEEWK